jgi:hypothetical protein
MIEEILPLKAKYRRPGRVRAWLNGEPAGLVTRVFQAGRFTSKSNYSGKAQKPVQGLAHRRRSYFCGCGS